MTGFAISLLQIESASIIGNGERQPAYAVCQRDVNLPCLCVPAGIVGGFLSDAQQFLFDLRRARTRFAGDCEAAACRGGRSDSLCEFVQSLRQALTFER